MTRRFAELVVLTLAIIWLGIVRAGSAIERLLHLDDPDDAP